MWSQIASIRGLKRLNTIFSFHQESINGPFSICDPNACYWRRVMAFQKETIIDFSEVRKCPQVLLEQMKLCMTSSLLGLISDLWTGNNKDPDVIETYEWGKKKIHRATYPVLSECMNMGAWFPFFLFVIHIHTHTKDCDICLSLVFIDPGMEEWPSQFSFNQTVIGIGYMLVCVWDVCEYVHVHGGHTLSADINADLSRWRSKEGTEPESGLSNWILVQ